MIGVVFGIILPLLGIWTTSSALSAAQQCDDHSEH